MCRVRTHGAEPLPRCQTGGEFGESAGVAVVAPVRDQHAGVAGVLAGDAQGQVVGLRAAVGEEDPVQGGVEGREQGFRIVHDAVVEVARVQVEPRHLLGHRGRDDRVGVADVRDVVVAVQVDLP